MAKSKCREKQQKYVNSMCFEPQGEISLYLVFDKNELTQCLPTSETLIPINSTATCGENIGQLSYYCELRAHYWVWKNLTRASNSFVGFFHYRRYLDFSGMSKQATYRRPPYRFFKAPDISEYTRQKLWPLLCDYDVVAPIAEYTGIPVWIRYANAAGHKLHELVLARKSIEKRFPNFLESFDSYLTGMNEYYCNMFVMRGTYFDQYCEWLFAILSDIKNEMNDQLGEKTLGYLGERLFGVYYTKCAQEKVLRCLEVPRIHFWVYDDATHHFKRNRLIYSLLPPGSERLALVRRRMQNTSYREDEYEAYFNDCDSSL